MKKSIFPLLLGGLGIGTTEFVIMGLLPDVARDFRISIPEAGHFISAYALGVVVGAPLLVMMTSHLPPKKTLLGFMVIFTLFNGLSAIAGSNVLLLVSRFFAGLPHGAFFGVGAVVASRLAADGKKAQAISMMFAGLTIANLAMVPLGTWIGHNYSWRYTFGLVSVIGLITLLFIKWWLPEMPANKNASPRNEMRIFQDLNVWLVLLMIAIGTGGLFAWISYIAPLMTEVSGFADDSVSSIMILAGSGMVVGNIIGGKLADRFKPVVLCACLFAAMATVLLLIFFFAEYKVMSLILTFFAGALSMAIGSPIQILMINTAKDAEMLGAAATQAAFNTGNTLGAFLGGLPIAAGFGYTSPEIVGMIMALTGTSFAILLIRRHRAASVIPEALANS
ncbi:MAG: MFS transporter [Chitinophagaceae bacterium]|nr:MAG: MFS transporter [Chitinophagaceae bacterium]